MKNYELVVVLDGKTTAAKTKAEIANLEELVKVAGGSVKKTENWGVKELAYKIQKSETGLFLIFTLELDGKAAKSLPEKVRLENQIIRYLLIRKEESAKNGKKSK